MKAIQRIHHISALGGKAQDTIDFYRNILNIDLIKATVNFAGGDTYHLFFANGGKEAKGAMTYFDWDHKQVGNKGGGQGGQTAFRIPKNSLKEWQERLEEKGVASRLSKKFGQETLEFKDNSNVDLAFVEGELEADSINVYDFHGFELLSTDYQATATHLTDFLGLIAAGESNSYLFFDTAGEEKHRILLPKENMTRRGLGQGTVDHLALEVSDKEELDQWRAYLSEHGFENRDLTGQNYKKATYYREPGQVRIELVTKGLGMMVEEESNGGLGTELVIPPHLKDQEEEILARLPQLSL